LSLVAAKRGDVGQRENEAETSKKYPLTKGPERQRKSSVRWPEIREKLSGCHPENEECSGKLGVEKKRETSPSSRRKMSLWSHQRKPATRKHLVGHGFCRFPPDPFA
jgi:hypothetical protein